ncbi:MAG: hypothetical protein P8M22_00980 [Phycisphaerales bacterium]|nr:hypothetical protein [Phycisphaerales bacterium]
MLRRIKKTLIDLRLRQTYGADFFDYVKRRRQIHSRTPFSAGIYQDLLKSMSGDSLYSIHDYMSQEKVANLINVFARHDIDTQQCVDNMSMMLDINLELGVRTAAYFLVHDEYYHLADHREVVSEYRESGIEMGLHTQCYVDNSPLDYFRREIESFEDALGFSPKSFTIHGLGQFRIKTRMEFRRKIAKLYQQFGFQFSDAIKAHRRYQYVIQDCHGSPDQGGRYIYDDFIAMPPTLPRSSNVLILTHPCYWNNASS